MSVILPESKKSIEFTINPDSLGKIGTGIKSWWRMFTGQTSKELAEKNYNLQKQMFDYQMQLNQTQMDREDTAYQRAVKDANAAGLSSLSVGNGASSSSLSAGDAPQINDYASDNFMKGINLINTLNQFQNNLTQQVLQNKKQNAEINKINAETDAINRENQYFDYTIDKKKIMFDNDYYDSLIKNSFNNKYGFFNGASDLDKYAILKNQSKDAFAETIATNQFSQLGLILGVLQDIGKSITKGKEDSLEGLIKDLGKNIEASIGESINGVNNNKIVIDNTKLPVEYKDKIGSIIPEVAPDLLTRKEKLYLKNKNKNKNKIKNNKNGGVSW